MIICDELGFMYLHYSYNDIVDTMALHGSVKNPIRIDHFGRTKILRE